ncbi:retrovirus-related pol polyprotein from transposon TNT 1-94 [Tanacetum coccineum]|uniref:Retrovirus-related pol polyprotein from transposon TNT 1-94 n=1 Tax=Tanacetum coccineum TaxID=301880 RepID=A0ABQ5CXQ7_9ASTR
MDIQSKDVGYIGNGNRNAGRQNKNQATNVGNGLVQSIEEYDQNVKRIPRTKSTLGKTNVQCYNYNDKGHYARECPKPIVHDSKFFRDQMLLATKDEAGVHLDDEENDFMLDKAYGDNTFKDLNAAVIMMALIQPTDDKSDAKSTYDSKFISEVNASQIDMINGLLSKSNHEQPKPDTNAHYQYLHDFESMITNVQVEAEKQRLMNIELKKKKTLLQRELETCKERVKQFEHKPILDFDYKEAYEVLKNEMNVEKEQFLTENADIREELSKTKDETFKIKRETDLYKQAFKERENKYLEDIVSLEEKLDLMIELCTNNSYAWKKNQISTKLKVHLPDYEETLEDEEESRLKMKDKMIQLDYAKLNALYESFIP